ncbi:MAG TPA: hypothetical protein VFV89_11525 [Nocardioides sp.]|uniref:hypothetical protein n=1 Tax=Nocardioides sp. TaxID=35761 RepID=UPI002E3354CF|nr:hypothetical protein [Nocardioides sp.]HEX5088429.1 hypothetical protein [Nocardioides sp.]
MSATTDESAAAVEQEQELEHVHPLDEPATEATQTPEPVATRRSRGLGANRHLGSVVLSFLGVLGAYAAFDYVYYRTLGDGLTAYQGGEISDNVMIVAGVAAACLFVAAAAGRISALGPLLAGLVLGAGPCVWIVLDRASYVERANDIPEIWSHTSFGLVGAGAVLYPAVAGLLIGAAVAGRWRRITS